MKENYQTEFKLHSQGECQNLDFTLLWAFTAELIRGQIHLKMPKNTTFITPGYKYASHCQKIAATGTFINVIGSWLHSGG